uniref:Uncharacterized protein n=1 Tax=Tetranychus urticae TaxID=32264 RepID=T1K1S9_TETUR
MKSIVLTILIIILIATQKLVHPKPYEMKQNNWSRKQIKDSLHSINNKQTKIMPSNINQQLKRNQIDPLKGLVVG